MSPIIDLHMHVVPCIDDGSQSMEESLEMLRFCEKQGITDIFCTSHSGCIKEKSKEYFKNLKTLKELAKSEGIKIHLHKGCEIVFSANTMNEILNYLESGIFSTLGETEYVLTELYPDVELQEALFIIDELKKNGYKPIIAHMERIYSITGDSVNELIKNGALIQLNASNLVDNSNPETRERARQLLKNEYVHFIGSDGHQINHRPPVLTDGINYILNNADESYASEIIYGNFLKYINR